MASQTHHHSHTQTTHCTPPCPVFWRQVLNGDEHSYLPWQGEPGEPERFDSQQTQAAFEAQRTAYLEREKNATNGSDIVDARRDVYGDPVTTYVRVAAIMSAILDHEVQPWQAPLLMIAVKLVRTAETPTYSDNSDDIDGYLKMFREIIGDDMIQAKSVADFIEQVELRKKVQP